MVIVTALETFEYVAVMTAVPLVRAVTTPAEETVATDVLEEVHVAELVTSWVAPDTVAVAMNCELAPTAGTVPVMVTSETELGDVDESQATAKIERKSMRPKTAIDRINIQTPVMAALRWLFTLDRGSVSTTLATCEKTVRVVFVVPFRPSTRVIVWRI